MLSVTGLQAVSLSVPCITLQGCLAMSVMENKHNLDWEILVGTKSAVFFGGWYVLCVVVVVVVVRFGKHQFIIHYGSYREAEANSSLWQEACLMREN